MASQYTKIDRFYLWPSVVSTVLIFLFTLIVQMSRSLGFVIVIEWVNLRPAVNAILIGICLFFAVKKRWRTSLSFAAIPAVAWVLHQPIIFCAPYLHLLLLEPVYHKVIASSREPVGSRFVTFDWSVGFAGDNTFLIYDETDAISRPAGKQSETQTQKNGFGPMCAGNVRHLVEHYYLCNF